MSSVESKISYELNKHPGIKKAVKRSYQLGMYAISPKIKSEGNITRVSPDDGKEYFFGYYDKSPWDASGRYMLSMRANDTWNDVSPKEKAEIILIDTQNNNKIRKLAETSAWNVQQACMLQWLGPDFSSHILYNDCRDGKYCAVILELETGKERIIDAPVYTVSQDGKTALTLDFSRLYNLRPGYGYYNVPEKTKGIALPDTTAIWTIDIENNEVKPLLKYTDFAIFQPRKEMKEDGSVHKVNHLMISPNGKRFMVLYRWFVGQRKYTRLITGDVDGSNMYLLSDDDMVSHCCWKNDDEILAFENKHDGGSGYYLMKDRTQDYKHLWSQYSSDGHPSYSPDGKLVVTDSYPNRARVADIKVLQENEICGKVIAKVFAPFKYDNDTRCDLHPRWSRDGKKICFDSVYEGHRGLYSIDMDTEARVRVLYVFTSCKRSGPIQVMLSLISNLDKSRFDPYLITIYEEDKSDSELAKFVELGVVHSTVRLSKKDILINKTALLKREIEKIHPDIIHSMGVFPDYAISRMRIKNHVLVLHNFIYDDFVAKFGKIKGLILERMHISAIKRAKKVWTCSKSLSELYFKKKGWHFDYIQNGINTNIYHCIDALTKEQLRKKLNLPSGRIFIYTGQFIERKDQAFLLDIFSDSNFENCTLLLLGEGKLYEEQMRQYDKCSNIVFTGNVPNVNEYLQAADIYISSSKSEGLPMGVLEAMACGLPVLLSDIIQHKEIFAENSNIGNLYKLGDKSDCIRVINIMKDADLKSLSSEALNTVQKNFSAETMSSKYQAGYVKVLGKRI